MGGSAFKLAWFRLSNRQPLDLQEIDCGSRRARRLSVLPVALGLAVANFGIATVFAQGAPKDEAWKAPARAARKENPIPADANSITQGQGLFVMACVPCHGPTGRGDGSAAANLERDGVRVRPGNLTLPEMRQQTDGELFWKISEGRSPMPSWRESLTEEQRWLIVNYVRTLAQPGSKSSSTATVQTSNK